MFAERRDDDDPAGGPEGGIGLDVEEDPARARPIVRLDPCPGSEEVLPVAFAATIPGVAEDGEDLVEEEARVLARPDFAPVKVAPARGVLVEPPVPGRYEPSLRFERFQGIIIGMYTPAYLSVSHILRMWSPRLRVGRRFPGGRHRKPLR